MLPSQGEKKQCGGCFLYAKLVRSCPDPDMQKYAFISESVTQAVTSAP